MYKFKINQHVYFLNDLENCCFKFFLKFSEKESFDLKKFIYFGNVEEIHISKEGVFYDIRQYNFNGYPLELFRMIPEGYVSNSKREISDCFKQTIIKDVEFIKNSLNG